MNHTAKENAPELAGIEVEELDAQASDFAMLEFFAEPTADAAAAPSKADEEFDRAVRFFEGLRG